MGIYVKRQQSIMPAPETQSTENMKDLAQIPRCVHYVCSENKCINNTLLIKTKRIGVRGGGGGVAVRHHFNS